MGFNEFLSSIFGNKSTRDMKEIQPWVEKIKAAYPEVLLQPFLGILCLLHTRPDRRGHLAHDGRRPGRLPEPRRHAVWSLQPHLWLWRRTHDHGAQPLL